MESWFQPHNPFALLQNNFFLFVSLHYSYLQHTLVLLCKKLECYSSGYTMVNNNFCHDTVWRINANRLALRGLRGACVAFLAVWKRKVELVWPMQRYFDEVVVVRVVFVSRVSKVGVSWTVTFMNFLFANFQLFLINHFNENRIQKILLDRVFAVDRHL
jgi:hypothetical protein